MVQLSRLILGISECSGGLAGPPYQFHVCQTQALHTAARVVSPPTIDMYLSAGSIVWYKPSLGR